MRYPTFILFALAAATANADTSGVRAVPTYESVGLYWSSPPFGWTANGCRVRYRAVGQSSWKQGHDLWFDAASNE